ncbi:RHS repeat domain-containing protein [Dactylosporangium sp. CA-139114]|uniref:RHS repeat domain-containing protein n=1 Tax=Dactylosporangium sp. CA-139114 TaxID=3239931 RepID=UPI003D975891
MAATPVRAAAARPAKADTVPAVTAAPAVAWPAAGTLRLDVPAAGAGIAWARNAAVGVRPGPGIGRENRLAGEGAAASPASVHVSVLDRAVARRGGRDVLLEVSRADGSAAPGAVSLSVGYKGFKDAYGADWFRRLRLEQVPACGVSTPDAPGCAATPLEYTNDTASLTITATVPAAGTPVARTASTSEFAPQAGQGTFVALAAGASSDGGDYRATDLKASDSWSAGGSTGDFAWSYPVSLPPSLGGPAPKVTLGYSAQGVDGFTAAANSQPSWVGEGFGYQPGSIERGYRGCADDGQSSLLGDLCWAGDNATLSLNGRSSTLVYDSGSQTWRPQDDDGSKVERLNDMSRNNGDNDGEYWRVTTTDGTEYYFGLNRLPGWQSGNPETQSVFYEPVYGNNTGEPCNSAAGFAASVCAQQAYRWNLDYVVDPHGNSSSYFYAREMNQYAKNRTNSDVVSYVRGGYVTEIDYGTRRVNGVDNVFAGTAPARVLFGTAERCITPGATCTLTTANAANWPDVPVDRICTGSGCAGMYAPTFFTTKKLTSITTQVASGAKTWRRVQQVQLTHEYKNPGDGNQKILWLNSLRVCAADDNLCRPATTFSPTQLSNRVDMTGTTNGIIRYRIGSLVNESGGQLSLTYSAPQCVKNVTMPAAPDTNTLRCYPVNWKTSDSPTVKLEYFHKYRVEAVASADLVGGEERDEVTSYQYLGDPAWHYNPNPLTPANLRTWNVWRGYQTVRTIRGASDATRSQSDTTFFRGMNGDKTATGTRTANVIDSDGGTWADEEWLAGMAREQVTYLGTSTAVVSKTKTDPYVFGPTATQAFNDVTLTARLTGTAVTTTTTTLDGSRAPRVTRTTNTYVNDRSGRIAAVDDAGDVSTTADDRCTRTTFATSASGLLQSYPARVEVVSVRCAATPSRPADVLSDTRTFYDGAATFNGVVSKGDATRVEQVASWTGTTPNYQQMNVSTYDEHGRVLTSADALNHTTTTAYTPALDAGVTHSEVSDPKSFVTKRDVDPAYGVPTAVIDPNGKRTDVTYDGFGRMTAVWLPGRVKGSAAADLTFAYQVRNTGGPSSITTSRLDNAGNGYIATIDLYDGWLRRRQTQTPANGGGRLITESLYDTRGLAYKTRDAYYDPSAPSTTLMTPTAENAVPSQTIVTYDGAGRATVAQFQVAAANKWKTVTTYGGDRIDVTVPLGATATSTYTDARGQVTKVKQYRGNIAAGASEDVTYTYTKAGDRASATDPAGNVWTWTYDQLRRMLTDTSPDRGQVTYTYDAAGNVATAADARPVRIAFAYDELNRRTGEFLNTTGGTQLAGWTYDRLADNTWVRGQAVGSTRYEDTGAYTTQVTSVDEHYRPTGTKVTIPPAAGTQLAGDYVTSTTYNADGTVHTTSLPAKSGTADFGGLADETLTFGYTTLGLPTTMSGLSSYVTQAEYDQLGQLGDLNLTDGGGKNILQYWSRESGTNRLKQHQILGDFASNIVASDVNYAYDDAGNVTSVADKTAQWGAGADDNQCFRYDSLRRLTEAWTPASGNCTTNPTTAGLGGPEPYWTSYSYDTAGNRSHEIVHGGTTVDNTYAYPASGATAVRPHAVSSVKAGSTAVSSYTYDNAGNEVTRVRAGKTDQSMTWNPDGRLASLTQGTATTTYVYGAGGDRLLVKEQGATTLYLSGAQYRLAGSSVQATRTYAHPAAGAVATRTTAGLTWQTTDHHGTAQLSFRASDLAATVRRTAPFGGVRGANPAWPSSVGFVGGINDASELVHVGAREYDPAVGRFISVDPVFSPGDPQGWQGYGYANNTPVSASDPTGLKTDTEFYGPCGKDGEYCTPPPPGPTCQPSGSANNCPSGSDECRPSMSANNCGAPQHNPKDIKAKITYPHGTTLTFYYDGTRKINDVDFDGGADPYLLARKMDENLTEADLEYGPDPVSTLWQMKQACNPKICSYEFLQNVTEAHRALQNLSVSVTTGPCVSGSISTGTAAMSAVFPASLCLLGDNHGHYAVTLTIGAGHGVGNGRGWTVGANQYFANGEVKDQLGAFTYVDVSVSGKRGWGVTYTHAWGGGIHADQTGVAYSMGSGTPVSVDGGVSYTFRLFHWNTEG